MRVPSFDVTLSVWNEFHSREQCTAFVRAGLRLFWIGNRRRPPAVVQGRRDYLSVAWLYAAKILPQEFCRQASMTFFDWFAGFHALNSRVLWAFAPMNTRLISKAIAQNVPVILDVAIGHQRIYQRVMTEEHKKLGLPVATKLIENWVRKYEWEYANANWLSVGSRYVKKTLVAHGIAAERILVNPYGVDGPRWKSCHDQRITPGARMVFAFVASVIPRKGIHYLVEAWRLAALQDAELIVVGGPREAVERLCGPLPNSVTTPGRLTHEELQAIYSRTDVYVLPSLLEGLARSGVEAMAAGLPLLITEETGLTDFVRDGVHGWVVPARSVEALVAQLRWCREHPAEVREAGEQAYEVGRKQTFESYGDRCALIAKAVADGQDPRAVPGVV